MGRRGWAACVEAVRAIPVRLPLGRDGPRGMLGSARAHLPGDGGTHMNGALRFIAAAGAVFAAAIKPGRAAAFLLMIGAVASTANAQWTVVNLHPDGASASYAYGVSGGQQVGYATVGGFHRASLWSGTAASWVDLNPAGATESLAFGVEGGQ